MEELDKMLKELELKVNTFYVKAIDLHNNNSLRSLGGHSITISNEEYGSRLFYGKQGFYAGVIKCIESACMGDEGVYRHPEYNFKEKHGKLYVRSHNGTQEMLELFPYLKIETIEGRITEHLKKYVK